MTKLCFFISKRIDMMSAVNKTFIASSNVSSIIRKNNDYAFYDFYISYSIGL